MFELRFIRGIATPSVGTAIQAKDYRYHASMKAQHSQAPLSGLSATFSLELRGEGAAPAFYVNGLDHLKRIRRCCVALSD